jgi:hypothetical protein
MENKPRFIEMVYDLAMKTGVIENNISLADFIEATCTLENWPMKPGMTKTSVLMYNFEEAPDSSIDFSIVWGWRVGGAP